MSTTVLDGCIRKDEHFDLDIFCVCTVTASPSGLITTAITFFTPTFDQLYIIAFHEVFIGFSLCVCQWTEHDFIGLGRKLIGDQRFRSK